MSFLLGMMLGQAMSDDSPSVNTVVKKEYGTQLGGVPVFIELTEIDFRDTDYNGTVSQKGIIEKETRIMVDVRYIMKIIDRKKTYRIKNGTKEVPSGRHGKNTKIVHVYEDVSLDYSWIKLSSGEGSIYVKETYDELKVMFGGANV